VNIVCYMSDGTSKKIKLENLQIVIVKFVGTCSKLFIIDFAVNRIFSLTDKINQ